MSNTETNTPWQKVITDSIENYCLSPWITFQSLKNNLCSYNNLKIFQKSSDNISEKQTKVAYLRTWLLLLCLLRPAKCYLGSCYSKYHIRVLPRSDLWSLVHSVSLVFIELFSNFVRAAVCISYRFEKMDVRNGRPDGLCQLFFWLLRVVVCDYHGWFAPMTPAVTGERSHPGKRLNLLSHVRGRKHERTQQSVCYGCEQRAIIHSTLYSLPHIWQDWCLNLESDHNN